MNGSTKGYYRFFSPTCDTCRHIVGFTRRNCAAFPDGIPRRIWNGDDGHLHPVEGDHEIQYAPLTEEDKRRARALADELDERVRSRIDRQRQERGLSPIDWDAFPRHDETGEE